MRQNSENDLTRAQIRKALSPYDVSPNDEQIARIQAYLALLLKWNRSISLTAVTDPVDIVGRHFGESIFVSKLLPVENCRLVDIGTGAGFPALAIKIAYPTARIVLVESNNKKNAFLSEVVRVLELSEVEIVTERFENIRPDPIRADIVTARALGQFKTLIRWCRSALAPRGHIVLWVGSEDSTRLANNPDWTWQPAVHIPESQRRFILIGRPIVKTE